MHIRRHHSGWIFSVFANSINLFLRFESFAYRNSFRVSFKFIHYKAVTMPEKCKLWTCECFFGSTMLTRDKGEENYYEMKNFMWNEEGNPIDWVTQGLNTQHSNVDIRLIAISSRLAFNRIWALLNCSKIICIWNGLDDPM